MNQGRVLNLIVRASSGSARSVLMGISFALADIARHGGKARIALTALGAIGVGFGVALLIGFQNLAQSAIDFDTAIRRVYTLTEVSGPKAFNTLKAAVIDLTRELPKMPAEMATALYDIKTVVADDADALAMLKSSAKAASLELGATEPIAKSITSLYQVYGNEVKNVAGWTDQLTQAVSVGRAEYTDFAAALGPILAYGNSIGASFKEQATMLAFLTRRGFSASQAATQLRNTFMKILNPAALAVKEYKRLGIQFGEAGVKAAGGLIPWLDQLMKKTGGNTDTLRKLFPNLRALPMLLAYAKDEGKDVGYVLDSISNSAGTLDERLSRAMEGPQAQINLLKAGVESLKITVGNFIVDAVMPLVKKIQPLVWRVIDWINANPKLVKTILQVIAAFAGFSIIIGGIGLLIGLFEILWSAVGGIVVIVTALSLAFVPVIMFLTKLWDAVKTQTSAIAAFKLAWDNVKIAAKELLPILRGIISNITGQPAQLKTAASAVEDFAQWIYQLSVKLRQWAQSPDAYEFARKVVSAFQSVYGWFQRMFAWLKEHQKLVMFVVKAAGALLIFNLVFGVLSKAVGGFIGIFTGGLKIFGPFGNALGLIGGKAKDLTQWFGKTSVGIGIFSKVDDAVKGLGGSIIKLMGGFRSIAGWTMTYQLIWGKVVSLFTGGIGRMLGGVKSFGGLLARLPGLVVGGLRSVPGLIAGIFTKLPGLIMGAIRGIPAAIAGVFSNLGGLSGILGRIVSVFATGFSGIGSAISAVGPILAAVATAAAPVIAVIAAIAGVAYTLYKYWDQVKKVFSSTSPFIQGLIAVFSPLIQQLKAQLLPLWNSLKDLFNQLKPVLIAIGAVIGTVLVVALGLLTGIVAGVVGALSGIVQVIRGIIQFISGLVQVIVNVFKLVWGLLTGNQSMVDNAQAAILNGFKKMGKGIVNVFKGLWGTIKGFVSGLVKGIISFFKGLWNTLVGHSIIPEMIAAIVLWFAKLPGLLASKLVAFVRTVVAKATELATKLRTWASTTARNMLTWVIGIGAAIANGIKQGIRNTWDSLVAKLRSVVNMLPAAVKRLLGISSPSRVFASLGSAIPQGMAQGILGSIDSVTKAQAQMINAVNTNPQMSVGYGMEVQQRQTVTHEHKVSWGTLPPGLQVSLDAREVAALLTGDEKAMKDISRKVTYNQVREIR